MVLRDFIKVLDTIEPITVYMDGDEFGAYDKDEIPNMFKDMELTDVFIDEDGIGVAIYS